jgi:hypothetical protein
MAGEKGKEKAETKVDQALLDEDDDFEEFMTEGGILVVLSTFHLHIYSGVPETVPTSDSQWPGTPLIRTPEFPSNVNTVIDHITHSIPIMKLCTSAPLLIGCLYDICTY